MDRVDSDYSEDAGHDAAWAGITRHTYLRDRLDRVFASGRYTVQDGAAGGSSLDVLHAELSQRDVATFPALEPGVVRRCDLNGSPGWATDRFRFLIASAPYGQVDAIRWQQKSQTKQLVAAQPDPDPDQPFLFDAVPDDDDAEGSSVLALDTLIVAHSQDIERGRRQLVIGRPRLNSESAWHWMYQLHNANPPTARPLGASVPATGSLAPVPDAPVRLRRQKTAQDLDLVQNQGSNQ